MLSVTVEIQNKEEFDLLLLKLGFFRKNGFYIFKTNNRELLRAEYTSDDDSAVFKFSPGLNLEEYTTIHHLLKEILQDGKLNFDDSNSLLGYLKNGEGAYILTNWYKWYEFLQDAKLKSLEGKKVRVLDEKERELASGLFVEYKKDNASHKIIQCSVITLLGERTYSGNALKIEPTNEW
ncbi:hypothetical protein [Bacillus sp. FJAT-47783]|uniref:hypothetical protein n=1 Tax=Bacillus sp. FJAT-47783 TaxID=2922712 RepID=UPI001FAD0B64|nr:hypothetical protein [Bacillus sp. FJAT-47783]